MIYALLCSSKEGDPLLETGAYLRAFLRHETGAAAAARPEAGARLAAPSLPPPQASQMGRTREGSGKIESSGRLRRTAARRVSPGWGFHAAPAAPAEDPRLG